MPGERSRSIDLVVINTDLNRLQHVLNDFSQKNFMMKYYHRYHRHIPHHTEELPMYAGDVTPPLHSSVFLISPISWGNGVYPAEKSRKSHCDLKEIC